MRAPAASAIAIAANTASQAPALIAWLMPDTCRIAAAPITSRGSVSGVIRDAADPARKYENS